MAVGSMCLLTFCASGAAASADPSLRTVLSRLERYVEGYESALSTLVARERYVQIEPAGEGGHIRTLVSDFLFFRLPGRDGPWLGFRDVLDVDGTPLEHQGERLREIVGSPETAEARAMAMSRENERYNIGRFRRTVNVPVCVVAWMHPRVRDRFRFRQSGEEQIDGTRTWRIDFEERRRPTIVRTPDGRDVASSGSIWIDAGTGRVFQTELKNTLDALHVTIQVRFRMHQDFGLLVPWRMQERYEDVVGRLDTEAIYSDYRRFTATARIRDPVAGF
jgi:hypothetical protein